MFLTRKSQASSVRTRVGMAARTGIHDARVWAAPHLDHTGHALEAQVAPKVAEMLSAAALRIDPDPARPRRRWPLVAAGLITAAGLSVLAAYLLKRRAAANAPESAAPADAAGTTMPDDAPGSPAASEGNGRVRTG